MWHWILTLMVSLQPAAPWRATYEQTARAIDDAAHEAPLYAGEDGPERTAAQLVALAWYESRFDPHAVARDAFGESHGLWQIHESNVRRLGLEVADLDEPRVAARAALVLLAESLHTCRARPERDRLAFYAEGRGRCDGAEALRASRARVGLARWLLRAWPVRWVEGGTTGVPPSREGLLQPTPPKPRVDRVRDERGRLARAVREPPERRAAHVQRIGERDRAADVLGGGEPRLGKGGLARHHASSAAAGDSSSPLSHASRFASSSTPSGTSTSPYANARHRSQ